MKHRLYPSLLIALAVTLVLASAARASDSEISTLKFSDPAKPGTLKISINHGDLRIHGADVAEITVKSDAQPITSAPRKDGLRVLTASSSFTLTEKDNVALLDYGSDWSGSDGADFNITVPRNTAIVVSSKWGGGDTRIADVNGDVEIKNMNGEVNLDHLGGGALVETMNGEIKASFAQLPAGKALSFTSMNGEVALSVPADAKANIRLRTQNGSILTDFDDKALITKTESVPRLKSTHSSRPPRPPAAPKAPSAVPAAPAAPVDPVTPVMEADQSSREALREAAHEAARASAEAMRASAEAVRMAVQAGHEALMDHGIPSMTGGKLVSGTLNGGGLEIIVTTMNGDVTLRKTK